MKIYYTALILFIYSLSYSQNYNAAMPVSKSDLELNYYEKDSVANALVIYDYGNSFIDKETFWLRSQIKQKIKILRKEGIEKGEVEIKLYKGKSSSEKVKNIKGTTYNLVNGSIQKTELKPNAIFREENEKYTLVKFVLPNVKIGSVITYSYETQSKFIRKFQPWYFQGDSPVIYSEYNTSIPGNYEYNIKLVGTIPLDTHETSIEKYCIKLNGDVGANCSIAKYIMKDIPAYKPEDFTTTPLNYSSRIEYELSVFRGFDGRVDKITKTWAAVDKELKTDKNFGRQISKSSLAKKILPSEISDIPDDLEKAKAIYNYVLDNYKWNGKIERYDVSVKDLLKEKIGSVFEINLLLENLLTAQGFKVYPILLSTRSNGLATKIYPVLTDFNYVILKTQIGNNTFFLDATDPYLSFGELPFRCLNQYGRLIDFEDGSYWENINIEEYSTRQHRVELNSFEDEVIYGSLTSSYSRYHSHNVKERYDENPQSYKTKKADTYKNIEVIEHEVLDYDKRSLKFKEKIDFSYEPEFIGNKIYLNPFIVTFFEENPFKLQERTYPIDFGYKDIYSYALNIDLKEGLKIVEIPDPITYALPDKTGSFIFNVDKKDNNLVLNFKVKFDTAIYSPEFYKHLKKFMNKVVETQKNTVVVLEKQ